MTAAPLNGHNLSDPPPLPEPAPVIARAVYEHQQDPTDVPWDDLDDEDRQLLTAHAVAHISAHMGWLEKHGFRVLPPGAVLRPKSDDEAAAMDQAVRLYAEAKKRKAGLLMGEKKLILPPGSTRQ